MTLTLNRTATALTALTRAAAQWRQDYEDGRHNGGRSAEVEAAFETAYSAGATPDEAAAAYQDGIDWGMPTA